MTALAMMSVRPILARYNGQPTGRSAGPFACRHPKSGIRLSFYLRHMGRDPQDAALFYRRGRKREEAYARGVVHEAMAALWADSEPKLDFVANGNRWHIERLRVKAQH